VWLDDQSNDVAVDCEQVLAERRPVHGHVVPPAVVERRLEPVGQRPQTTHVAAAGAGASLPAPVSGDAEHVAHVTVDQFDAEHAEARRVEAPRRVEYQPVPLPRLHLITDATYVIAGNMCPVTARWRARWSSPDRQLHGSVGTGNALVKLKFHGGVFLVTSSRGSSRGCPQQVVRVGLEEFRERHAKWTNRQHYRS